MNYQLIERKREKYALSVRRLVFVRLSQVYAGK